MKSDQTLPAMKHLYPTDLLSMALALLFSLFSFLNVGKLSTRFFGMQVDHELLYGTIFLLIAVVLPFLFRLTNHRQSRTVQFVRLFYPQFLYLVFYEQAIVLSQLFYGARTFDAVFAHADRLIFGFEPAIRFHLVFTGDAIINELFFFGYFSFFLLITVGWWGLYAKGRVREAVWAFTVVTLSFYTLYFFYAFFPVEGPKYYFASLHREWYSHFRGYLFTAFLRYVFDNVNLAGAAFPSSHVVISTLSLLLNRRYNPRLAAAFLPITVLLYFSTVYLYAHYAVDGIAGLIVAAIFWWTVPRVIGSAAGMLASVDAAVARLFKLAPIAALEPCNPLSGGARLSPGDGIRE